MLRDMDDDRFNELLESRRESYLRGLGELTEQVVSRLVPVDAQAWPASVLGRMRTVRRKHTRLLVTDGLSCPYDPRLHANPPPAPLDYELAVEVPNADAAALDDARFAESWYPQLLYSLTRWIVPEWLDLRGLLGKFRAVTLSAPATTAEAQALADPDGMVGFVVGLPLLGNDLDLHPYLNDYYQGGPQAYAHCAIGYFPIKPLTPDEYAWAKSQGNEGAVLLAQKFLARGDGHRTWAGRPSVLAEPHFPDA